MQLFNATDLFTNEPERLNQNVDEIEGGRLFMNPPEFQYYINIGETTGDDTLELVELNFGEVTLSDVSFAVNGNTNPSLNFGRRADILSTRNSTLEGLCEDLAPGSYPLSYTTSILSDGLSIGYRSGGSSTWNSTTANTSDTFDLVYLISLDCEVETTIPFEPEQITVVNNKQLYHQLYDIKMLLLFFFLWYATISSYRIIRNVFTSNIVENDAKKNT